MNPEDIPFLINLFDGLSLRLATANLADFVILAVLLLLFWPKFRNSVLAFMRVFVANGERKSEETNGAKSKEKACKCACSDKFITRGELEKHVAEDHAKFVDFQKEVREDVKAIHLRIDQIFALLGGKKE